MLVNPLRLVLEVYLGTVDNFNRVLVRLPHNSIHLFAISTGSRHVISRPIYLIPLSHNFWADPTRTLIYVVVSCLAFRSVVIQRD